MAWQRLGGASSEQLAEISREISGRRKEFETALRVVEALRVVCRGNGGDGMGDALLSRLLGDER